MNWTEHKRLNPDWIGNNPGVNKCPGKLIRTMKALETKTKVFHCQLRHDHTSFCINYTGRKTWMKGIKKIEWEQLYLTLNSSTEPQESEAVRKALSLLDSDTKP